MNAKSNKFRDFVNMITSGAVAVVLRLLRLPVISKSNVKTRVFNNNNALNLMSSNSSKYGGPLTWFLLMTPKIDILKRVLLRGWR
jgi:hypothetical protein